MGGCTIHGNLEEEDVVPDWRGDGRKYEEDECTYAAEETRKSGCGGHGHNQIRIRANTSGRRGVGADGGGWRRMEATSWLVGGSSVLLAVSGIQGIRGGRGGGSGNGKVEEVEAEAGRKQKERKKERKRRRHRL